MQYNDPVRWAKMLGEELFALLDTLYSQMLLQIL